MKNILNLTSGSLQSSKNPTIPPQAKAPKAQQRAPFFISAV